MRDLVRFPLIYPLVTIGLALMVAVLVGQHVGSLGLTYQDVIIILVVGAAATIALQKRGVEVGFLIWIGMFAVGYRVLRINAPVFIDQLVSGGVPSKTYLLTRKTPELPLHPLVLVMLGLFVLLVLQRAVLSRQPVAWGVPRLLLLFSVFWVVGWAQGTHYGRDWNWMFVEFVNFAMMFPIFIVTASLLQEKTYWRPVITVFFGVGTGIALLGVLEYFFPGVRNLLPGFILNTGDLVLLAQDGFVRASFSFWGATTAVFISVLSLPMIIPLWRWFDKLPARLILASALGVQLVSIYLAGWRSVWFLIVAVPVALLATRRNWLGLLVFLLVLAIGFSLLPPVAQERFETFVSAVEGRYEDTSSAKRAERIEEAIVYALRYPLGLGWTGSGWVHNDFLQVAANLGIGGGVVFVAWYGLTMFAIWRRTRRDPDLLTLALFAGFLLAGGLLLFQNIVVLPQTALPIWFIWAMVHTRLRETAPTEGDTV